MADAQQSNTPWSDRLPPDIIARLSPDVIARLNPDIIARVFPTHSESRRWLEWPQIFHKLMGTKLFYGHSGIQYVVQAVHDGSFEPRRLRARIYPSGFLFLSRWNPQFNEEEWLPIVEGDQSILATFHSGAIHAIKKLREHIDAQVDMPVLERETLIKCVDTLESDIHHQFIQRFSLELKCANEAREAEMELLMEAVAEKIAKGEFNDEGDVSDGK